MVRNRNYLRFTFCFSRLLFVSVLLGCVSSSPVFAVRLLDGFRVGGAVQKIASSRDARKIFKSIARAECPCQASLLEKGVGSAINPVRPQFCLKLSPSDFDATSNLISRIQRSLSLLQQFLHGPSYADSIAISSLSDLSRAQSFIREGSARCPGEEFSHIALILKPTLEYLERSQLIDLAHLEIFYAQFAEATVQKSSEKAEAAFQTLIQRLYTSAEITPSLLQKARVLAREYPIPYEVKPVKRKFRGEIHDPFSHVYYLTEEQRSYFQLKMNAEGLLVDYQGELVNTFPFQRDFAMSSDGTIYLGPSHLEALLPISDPRYLTAEQVSGFHHSSFLAGEPVAAAGTLIIENGVVRLITNLSGHYQPEAGYMNQLIRQLRVDGIRYEPRLLVFSKALIRRAKAHGWDNKQLHQLSFEELTTLAGEM